MGQIAPTAQNLVGKIEYRTYIDFKPPLDQGCLLLVENFVVKCDANVLEYVE